MKIGYPCINLSLDCRSSKTFRLASYTKERVHTTIESNLNCLQEILQYNAAHGLLFFRISSQLIPFGSHPVNTYPWQKVFANELQALGKYIKAHDMRISMHPDQFTLINSPSEKIFQNSVGELIYHATILDAMELDATAKIQIHVGGMYGDREESIKRFITRFDLLPPQVKSRLIIENDDRLFTVKDCHIIYQYTGIPVLFDNLHHALNNNGESLREALQLCQQTWKQNDGLVMTDYSDQEPGARIGKHTQTLDAGLFTEYLQETHGIDHDIMFEIKDKEQSALRALKIMQE